MNLIEHLVTPGERYDIMLKMPVGADYKALVEYLDIRMRKVLGHASTRVRSL